MLEHDQINALLNQVDENRLIQNLQDMISIPSINPFEGPVTTDCRELEFSRFYKQCMDQVGLETALIEVVPDRPNVLGYLNKEADGPCLMFAGHLDTVGIEGYTLPFEAKHENGKVYGRGSCDMKAALAAYIETIRILKLLVDQNELVLKGSILVAGVVDEEHKMLGSKYISQHGPLPNFAIIGEPTELKVCHAHKGQLCMHIKTFGKAYHSSVPEHGINAIHHMADVIKAIQGYSEDLAQRTPHEVCGRARVNAGVIKGGSISSTVPDYCELEVDRRTVPGEQLEDIIGEYKTLLQTLTHSHDDFKYEIGEPTLVNPPLHTPIDAKVVTSIAKAFEAVENTMPNIGSLGGATDAPNYQCSAVVCGPGSILQAHTINEYVEVRELVSATKIYLHTALQLLT